MAAKFQTERLQLAIFMHATGGLRLLGCERNGDAKLRFVFDDPQQKGAQVELDFDRGAPVSATSLFASQKFLRRQMTDTLNRRIGEQEHGHDR
jgi:hypothetical protein